MPRFELHVNGRPRSVEVAGNTPLLYVLHDDFDLHGPKFGCGLAECGACSVLVDGKETRSCVTPVSSLDKGQEITTLEGLPIRWANQQKAAGKKVKEASPEDPYANLHPVQRAWIAEEVPQCGYCQNGMAILGVEFLENNPSPTDADIERVYSGNNGQESPHLCRCGTYQSIKNALHVAAKEMSS